MFRTKSLNTSRAFCPFSSFRLHPVRSCSRNITTSNSNSSSQDERQKRSRFKDFAGNAYVFGTLFGATIAAVWIAEWPNYRVRSAWTKLNHDSPFSMTITEVELDHERTLVPNLHDESTSAWPRLTRLDNVRMFQVVEWSEEGISKVKLSEFEMDDLPIFDAISYCWTTSTGSKEIMCNDRKVVISQSLNNALLERCKLKDSTKLKKSDYLWADTLCISQEDITEKNIQVRKIGQIFACARNVWIYAGDTKRDLPDSLSKILESTLVQEKGKLRYAKEGIAFFGFSYFERLWIVQEICNAKNATLMIDGQTVPWATLVRRARHLQETCALYGIADSKIAIHLRNIKTIDKIHKEFHSRKSNVTMINLILNTSHFKTGDPRDRIFALVGLAGDTNDGDWELLPDYGVSTEEVYKRFAMWALARKKDMRLLSLASSGGAPGSPDWPSWIPDLSARRLSESSILAVPDDEELPDLRLLPYLSGCRPHQRFADGGLRPYCLKSPRKWLTGGSIQPVVSKVTFADDNSILQVRGALIDEILETGDVAPFTLAEEDRSFTELLAWQHYIWDDELAEYFCNALETQLDAVAQWVQQSLRLATKPRTRDDWPSYTVLKSGMFHAHIPRDSVKLVKENAWRALMCNRLGNGNWARVHTDGLVRIGHRITSQRDIVAEMSLQYGTICPKFDLMQPCYGTTQLVHGKQASIKNELKRCLLAGALVPSSKQNNSELSLNELKVSEFIVAGTETVSERHFLQRFLPPETRLFMKHALPAIAKWFKDRRFCITLNSRCGAVPAGAKTGDVICVFLGATVPHVLRPNIDGTYTLIGECYIDGVMNGGAFRGAIDQPFQMTQNSQWQPRKVLSIR